MNRNKNTINSKDNDKVCPNKDKGSGNKSHSQGGNPNYQKDGYKGNGSRRSTVYPESKMKLDDSFGNDATTYFANAKMAEDNVKFSPEIVLNAKTPINAGEYYPTIFTIQLNPSAGVSEYDFTDRTGMSSPLRLAAMRFFTAITSFTGRIPSYGPQDIMMLILALGSYMEVCEWGRRAFGVLFKFDDLNRDVPRRLIEAMGIDFDDFVTNRETYLPQWNSVINAADTITVPDDIPWFGKCLKLYEKIYRENDTDMSAYYVLNPSSAWLLDETSYDQGTILDTLSWVDDYTNDTKSYSNYSTEPEIWEAFRTAHPVVPFSTYITKFRNITDALLNSATYNLLYGDIIKYASKVGGFGLWKPDLVYEDYRTPIVFEDNFNKIMHNFTIVGRPSGAAVRTDASGIVITTPKNSVYPDVNTNGIVYNPSIFQYSSSNFCFTANMGSTALANIYDYTENIVDYDTDSPDINYQVDSLMYKATCNFVDWSDMSWQEKMRYGGKINWNLADHYITTIHIFLPSLTCLKYDASTSTYSRMAANSMYNNGWFPVLFDGSIATSIAAMNNGAVARPGYVGVGSPAPLPVIACYPWEPIDRHPIFEMFYGNAPSSGGQIIHQRGTFVRGDIDHFMFVTSRKLRDMLRLTYQHTFMAGHIERR